MIKKIIALALIALVVWGAWYFISMGRSKCTVTLKTGVQEELSVRELRSVYAKDAYNWSSYKDCQITGEGKIQSIDAGCTAFKADLDLSLSYYTVNIGNGIRFLVTAAQMDGFAVGDKVSFTGKLTNGTDELHVYVLGTEAQQALVRLS